MQRRPIQSFFALLLGATLLTPCLAEAQTATATATAVNLRDTVPTEAHVAIVWQRNPEQDFQREHLAGVIETVKQERIVERVMQIVRNRVEADDLEEAQQGFDKLKAAVAPASLDAMFDAEEFVYCQVMDGQMAQHLMIVRMSPDAVQGYVQAANNLLEMAEEEADEEIEVTREEIDDAQFLTLNPPAAVPMQPTLVALDDLLVFSTKLEMARAAVTSLQGGATTSKFDDPRVTAALAKLPEAEDTVVIFDGKQQVASLKSQLEPVLENIRLQADDSPQAAVAARLIETMIEQISVSDLEVTVGYTIDGDNHSETLGTLLPGTEDRLLRKIIVGNKPFDAWNRWVPANAMNFSLNSGFSLLEVYHDLLDIFSREAPELAAEGLLKLEELQQQAGVNLEDDLLGLFSGEMVSVTLPGGQSVTALACLQPDHTRELLHRVVDLANQVPQVQQQNLELVESESLDGFEELHANIFAMLNARPVIGFKDGWMIVASTPDAAQAVLDVRWGEAEDITSSDSYKRFSLDIDGPVSAVTYADTAANIRQAAQFINQASAMAPLFLGAAMAEAKPEDAQAVQQALGLLPSIAKVIESFDFMEASLYYTKSGDQQGTYHKHGVMLIRQD